MNVLSICSGIGGLDLFTRGQGWKTAAYVERDEYRQAVLHARMRDGWLDSAPIWPDLKTFDGVAWRGVVDCIVGGFPCQPFSSAARGRHREGIDLRPDIVRIAWECSPTFVFAENPSRAAVVGLGEALTEQGYTYEVAEVPAACVGAPHIRERWWLLANSNGDGKSISSLHDETQRQPTACTTPDWDSYPSEVVRVDDGSPYRMERTRALGDAVVNQQATLAWNLLTA